MNRAGPYFLNVGSFEVTTTVPYRKFFIKEKKMCINKVQRHIVWLPEELRKNRAHLLMHIFFKNSYQRHPLSPLSMTLS